VSGAEQHTLIDPPYMYLFDSRNHVLQVDIYLLN